MSAALGNKISTALLWLDSVITSAFELQRDDKKSPEDNLFSFEVQIELIGDEVKMFQMYMDDVREAQEAWFNLIKTSSTAQKVTEEQTYSDFVKDSQLAKKMVANTDKLMEIKKVIRNLKLSAQQEAKQIKVPKVGTPPALPAAVPVVISDLKLPNLDINLFDGQKSNWPEFIENFEEALSATQATEKQKMLFRRKYINSEVREMIKGIGIDGYDAAIAILKEQYGNEEEFIRALHSNLCNLPRCSNFNELKDFAIKLEALVRQLEQKGENVNGPQTYLELEKRLPSRFLREILKRKSKCPTIWSTELFRKNLAELIKEEEAVELVLHSAQSSKSKVIQAKPGEKNVKFEDKKPRLTKNDAIVFSVNERQKSFFTNRAENNIKGKLPNKLLRPAPPRLFQPKCRFCDGSHYSAECKNFNSYEKRVDIVRSKQLCFNCLLTGHMSSKCPKIGKIKCFKCSGKHNVALCNKMQVKEQKTSAAVAATEAEPPNSEPVSAVNDAKMQNALGSKKALLMCLKATVYNHKEPQNSALVYVFFDTGSHRSFISTHIAEKLQLPCLSNDRFWINSFGASDVKQYHSPKVKFGLITKKGNMILTANKVDQIIREMPSEYRN